MLRPAADRDEQLGRRSALAVRRASRSTLTVVGATRRPRVTPSRRRRRAGAAPARPASPANGSSRASTRGAPSSSDDLRAERRPRLRQLDADDAAAEHEQLAGHLLRRRRLAVRPRRAPRRGPGSAASPRRAGRDDDRLAAPPARRRRPSTAARRRAAPGRARASTPRSSSHGTWRVVRRSWITSSRRASTAGTSSRGGRWPRPRPAPASPRRAARRGAAAPSTACTRRSEHSPPTRSLLDERDREAALGQPPGGDLAGRAGADHDDVEAALGHGTYPPGNSGRDVTRRREILSPCAAPSLSSSSPLAFVAACGCGDSAAPVTGAATRAAAPATAATVRRAPRPRRPVRPPLYVTSAPGDRWRLLVDEQAGRIVVVRDAAPAAPAPRHPLAGDLRRRAGPALARVRPRLRHERALLRLLHRPRRSPESSSTARSAADRADPGRRARVLRWTTPTPTTTAADAVRTRPAPLHRHR